MNARFLPLSFLFIFSTFFSLNLNAQLEMKLQATGQNEWGVFVKPVGVEPTENVITGSGQVTVVMPSNYFMIGWNSVSGLWQPDATYDSPSENPGRKYVSFGLIHSEPNYPIEYDANNETLLFSFLGNGDCLDTIYLIDCNAPNPSDPFCPPNSHVCNPGNDLQVFDISNFEYYNYTDIYAPMAWNCSDNDGDGLPNGMEDTNGNGVYDPDEDASDLNDPFDPSIEYSDSVAITVKLLPNRISWGIFLKPVGGFIPTENSKLDIGTVTIAATPGFQFKNLQSHAAGEWLLTNTVWGSPDQPGNSYYSFGLSGNGESIDLSQGEVMLFSFTKDGDCPDELFIIDDSVPDNIPPNYVEGLDEGTLPPTGFLLAGTYESSSLNCLQSSPPQAEDGDGFNGGGVVSLGHGNSHLNSNEPATSKPAIFPNPSPGPTTFNGLTGYSKLEILDLNGRILISRKLFGEGRVEVDLTKLPNGVYLAKCVGSDGNINHLRIAKQ